MGNDRLHHLKAGAIEETRKLLGIAAYLWVLLSLFSLHKALILNEGNLFYQQGFAVINALALAKVILAGEYFHLGEDSRNRPLVYPILFKSIIFAVLLICFHVIEETLIGKLHGKTLYQSIPDAASGKLQRILMIGIIMFVVLIPFFAFRELERVIGPEELRSLVFGGKERARAAPLRLGWQTAVAAAALAALGGGWFIWSLHRSATADYVTQKLERASAAGTVTAIGVLRTAAAVPVGARVPGVIEAVDCDIRMKVKAGQVCAKIGRRPYQIMADLSKSSLAEAEIRFEKDKADLARAKKAFDQHEALAARGAIPLKAASKWRKAYEEKQERTKFDETRVASLLAALHSAETILGETDVVAPVEGTVVSRHIEIGQTLAGGPDARPLFLIAVDPFALQAAAKIGESDIGKIMPGDRASFTVESLPNQTFAGEVTQIGRSQDTASDTYDVIISVPNPRLLLEPGMASAITIETSREGNVLHAPAGTAFSTGQP